jgi:hypothetical protein
LTALALGAASRVRASDTGWSGEIHPYFWLTGNKGELTVNNTEFGVDQKIDTKRLHGAFSFLGAADYNRWVGYINMDWQRFADDKDTRNGNLRSDTDFVDATFAGGRRFGGWQENQYLNNLEVNLMAGLKYTHFHFTADTAGVKVSNDLGGVDAVGVLWPKYHIRPWVTFDPTFSAGGGYSDFTYEGTPQLSFVLPVAHNQVTAHVGYRWVHYKVHNSVASWDGTYKGPTVGVGYKF